MGETLVYCLLCTETELVVRLLVHETTQSIVLADVTREIEVECAEYLIVGNAATHNVPFALNATSTTLAHKIEPLFVIGIETQNLPSIKVITHLVDVKLCLAPTTNEALTIIYGLLLEGGDIEPWPEIEERT